MAELVKVRVGRSTSPRRYDAIGLSEHSRGLVIAVRLDDQVADKQVGCSTGVCKAGDRRILTDRQNVVRVASKGFNNDDIGRRTRRQGDGLVICSRNRKIPELTVTIVQQEVKVALAASGYSQVDDFAAKGIKPVGIKFVAEVGQRR